MDSGSKLMVVAAFLLLTISSFLVVDARLADTSIVRGPDCIGKSEDQEYNGKVARLINIFVDETKNVQRSHHSDYSYVHSYPNRDNGSVIGGATCDRHLWKLDCWACLVTAKNKLKSNCEHTLDARLELADCSIWYKMIQ
ncbi:unnamed protein product [Linum tenue]|uniref:Gnk2-homologous domain-containing protein n=2 Tax=Linum tenue TaxID=586396 RepID=A0AAV0HHY3_9ROSI|nr:unnamed protein product [Linum tenue]CAI0385072.1 unnamed protein product [Linum tenue]